MSVINRFIAKIKPDKKYVLKNQKRSRAAKKRADIDNIKREIYEKMAKLNWKKYCDDYQLTKVEPVLHYLKNWRNHRLVIPDFFDSNYYLAFHSDVANLNENPLVHFLTFGIQEERAGYLKFAELFTYGKQIFSDSKKTIIVAIHECTASGAPFVALALAASLTRKYNIIVINLRAKDKLYNAFLEHCYLYAECDSQRLICQEILKKIQDKYSIEYVIANSFSSYPIVADFLESVIPVVGLIHDYGEYCIPTNLKNATKFIEYSSLIVFPAISVQKSWEFYLGEAFQTKKNEHRIHIKHQGSVSTFYQEITDVTEQKGLRQSLNLTNNTIIIAGAGTVEVRKGVDDFIKTCYAIYTNLHMKKQNLAEKLAFVWFGDGFSNMDLNYGLWLEVYLQKTGIKDKFYFPGHVEHLHEKFAQVDLFLLTSRLDPFPNVAIDVLGADCSIGCFAKASGFVDFLEANKHSVRAIIAPYGDYNNLANQIVEDFERLIVKDGDNKSLWQKEFCFDDYANYIDKILESIHQRTQQ